MNNTVEEIWFFVQGIGEIWRKQGNKEEVVKVTKNSKYYNSSWNSFSVSQPRRGTNLYIDL